MRGNTNSDGARPARPGEAGFTLAEVLITIIILVFGLIAVTNLMILGAASNTVANAGTAAATAAKEALEDLKARSFTTLAAGGSLDVTCPAGPFEAPFARCQDVPGVGRIATAWLVTQIEPQVLYIHVRSEAVGGIGGARTRAEFTTFRSCTAAAGGCPAPPDPAATP